ncbi:DNA ligase D [Virgibacillus necropolis]|uniref:DNA ligase D n=1 Tax=Virgibacillus necropolis TaxID=163877 RepID=UPI00384AF8FA
MKLMQPISSEQIPTGDDWVFEVKYDGFRCVLHWNEDNIRLVSRKDIDLTDKFPEIVEFCLANQKEIKKLLPLKLDGELTIVNNGYQANFMAIQKRGRLNKKETIEKAAKERPASFLAFDLLEQYGTSLIKKTFKERKELLITCFSLGKFDSTITRLNRLCLITSYKNANYLLEQVFNYKGEGIIAKRDKSPYNSGKQHNDWLKVKNWRKATGILTFLDTTNDYFTVNVYDNEQLVEIGKCKHGVDSNDLETVKQLFVSKGDKRDGGYALPPAICAEINTLDLIKGEIREPSINQLLVNTTAPECTMDKMKMDMAMTPVTIEPSNTNKIFWPKEGVTKAELLIYLREISPYMLPNLKDRLLTVIRCPDGVTEQSFFQKHLPDYAPSFIKSFQVNDEEFFIGDHLESLLWFANHGAVEYHTPFQTIKGPNPTEIVFDLDPPDRDRFSLAIHAANILKQLLDDLKLTSFVKTSGNKGIQVHIPIPKDSLTYDETGIFTQAIAWTIENEYPTMFTTERLKKNRNDSLYLDYVQHGKDKTIITAYSPRKTEEATVATPLFWDEVKEGLTPGVFTINNVVDRVQAYGCPFTGYFEQGQKQDLERVFNLLGNK